VADIPDRHLVHGEWITVQQAAERLGVGVQAIYNWRSIHRRKGGRASLEDYWDWAMRWRRGEIKRHPGRSGRTYWVHGRHLTLEQAARRAGVSYKALYSCIQRTGCSVNSAVRHYEERAKQRAVKEILEIINEARR